MVIAIALTVPIRKRLSYLHSRSENTKTSILKYMFEELSSSVKRTNKANKLFFLCACFLRILILNILGLTPYVYTITRQIIFTLSIALPLWLSIVVYNIRQNFNHFVSHLVPLSTPMALSHFITIIESIRLIIRPITLSVRLCANITAGHILIALTTKSIIFISTITIPLMILLLLELAVAFIQRYVFTILLSIYLRETE